MATVFLSPGVYTREQDFTVFASRVGLTRLGLVGKALKGPAFEPILIKSSDAFFTRFGGTDPNYPLSYVANSYLSQANDLTVTRILGKTGFENGPAWLVVAGTGSTLSGATIAVIRSRRNQISGAFYFDQQSDIQIKGITGPLMNFTLSATTGPLTGLTNSGMTVSLDETKESYIVKQLSKNPEVTTSSAQLYVETIYPHFLREAVSRGEILDLKPNLVYIDSLIEVSAGIGGTFTDYNNKYTNAVTPWVVSRVIGSDAVKLFKFQSISDGDSSNREIKISIQNIDVNNLTFDVLVRRFEDTDATASSSALERFPTVTLDSTQPNYIARVIGTTNDVFPRRSNYITLDMAEVFPKNTVPAGFEGYTLRSTSISGAVNPGIYYKTTYLSGDSVFRTYMGISELGYTSLTPSNISSKNSVKTLEADLFSYFGGVSSGTTVIKGFHMENTANPTLYVSGDKNSLTGYTNAAGTLIDKSKLKFTLVPAGGFDGWDKYATYSNPYEQFTVGNVDNVDVYKDAIDTFDNREETDINLFATPGIDFQNNLSLVQYAQEIIESRADSLYIVDAPRLTVGDVKGDPNEVVSILESTGIDSNYMATYWPWIQINDAANNIYTYQSPTMMAVQAIAFTDNVAQPWFAPAGMNRGLATTNIIRADIKLKQGDRDTLYGGRINPIATFIQEGIVIWGQKTLQFNQSALDRVNIRRLLLTLRRLVSAASITLVFEQNDQTLRDQFLAKVEPILLQIQNQRGLTAFKVIMDDSNNTPETIDRNTLVGSILIKPTPTAEFLSLSFSVLPSGANFEDFA